MEISHPDTQPLVTAVIPTRNRPGLVCRAVRSALTQTYRNLEVVVVVDGPDPATVQALEQLHEPRLRIVALEENVGGSEARNIGVREAKGEWIALLDDDDEWLPQKIERQLALANSRASANKIIVFCRYIYRRPGKKDQIWPRRLPANEPLSEFLFDRHSGFQTSTFFVPRDYFLSQPFKTGLKGHQDWDWFLRAASDHSVEMAVDPEPQSIFHVAPKTQRVSYSFGWRDSLQWAQKNRSLMTSQAYSRFIAYHCLRLAVEQHERKAAAPKLFRECILEGKPTALSLGVFFLISLLSPKVRRKLHDSLRKSI